MHLRAGLDLLVRVDPHAGQHDALGADRHLVADRHALVNPRVRADVARPADHGALDEHAAADVGRRVDDRARRAGALAHGDARVQHRVRPDGGLRRDARVVADERGPLDGVEVVHPGPLADPDVPAQAHARDVQLHELVERVEVGLPVLVEVADVLPVALEHVPVDRAAHLEQQREELLREVVRPVGRHVAQRLRLDDVDARVDRVREDLAPRRLLEEALDATLRVGDDDAELERVRHGLQADGDRRTALAVERDERRQVEVAEGVAGDDEERVVELAGRKAHGTGGAGRRVLDRVLDVHAERLAVGEVAADRLRQEGDGHDHVVHAVGAEQLEDVLHARLADDRDHRLRLIRRQRAQARALAAGHDDGLHAGRPRISLSVDTT